VEDASKDLLAALTRLLPGFVTCWVVYGLTSHPKPTQFERVVQALVYSFLVGLLVSLEEYVFGLIGCRKFGASSELVVEQLARPLSRGGRRRPTSPIARRLGPVGCTTGRRESTRDTVSSHEDRPFKLLVSSRHWPRWSVLVTGPLSETRRFQPSRCTVMAITTMSGTFPRERNRLLAVSEARRSHMPTNQVKRLSCP
jgi:hypothetical protein